VDDTAVSVINQVLNQLEQRGAQTAPEQNMVRAVPHGKRRLAMPLLALGLALAVWIAAWQWMQIRKPVLSPVEGPQAVAVSAIRHQPVATIPAPVSAVPSAAVVTASAVVPVTVFSAAIASATPLAETLPPASHMSFELSSVPPPTALHPANAAPPARLVKSQPIQAAPPHARVTVQPSEGVAPMKQVSSAQLADAEFRKAVVLMQQGHIADAIAGYEATLRLDEGHDAARQALVALLLESKRGEDAEHVLQDRLKNKPEHTGFAMLLARLQVEDGAVEQATATLEKSLPYADSQAGYQAFFAALLQRQNRHKDAITHYQIALQLVPDNGVWLMGSGISLQAMQRTDEARNAFRRALDSQTLSPELQAFVQQKLKGL